MPLSAVLSDADLHGLVDDQLDPERRAEVLRRTAASPRDRATVEAWQDQGEIIRAAFRDVEREPLPASLDLRKPTLLHLASGGPDAVAPSGRRWSRWGGTAATMAVMAAGLAGSWLIASLPSENGDAIGAQHQTSEDDKAVADRTLAALAFAETETPLLSAAAEAPAMATIPDLSGAGFTFTGAEARGITPKAVVFRYRSAAGERVAIGAARARWTGGEASLARRDGGLTWHKGPLSFAIFGTVPPERLRALAEAVGSGAGTVDAARRP